MADPGAMKELDGLVENLTLEEQVALLSGADFWRTVALPHHGIPSIKTTDGPSGARGEFFDNGTPAALFPCGISLAATWNTTLIQEIGTHLGREARARGADVLLAPTVNIHRSPLGGRNFESFSEDGYLTGEIAAAYIRGVQSEGVAATIKHFVANEQETERMGIDSVVDERGLREIYLKPFEIALREARPWALMSSYNKVNGVQADASEWLLQKVLREEWGYDGTVISDWTAINETTGVESVKAGCDIEMPGPTKWRGPRVFEAIKNGQISPEEVKRAAANVLKLVQRTKGFNCSSAEASEQTDDNEALQQIIRTAGAEGIVLLKNENNILPIKQAKTIAIIGPNAKRCIAGGGGSAKVNPYYLISPFDGIKAATNAEMLYAQGCDTSKWLPLASKHCTTPTGEPGVTIEYYKGDKFIGEPFATQHKASTDLYLWDSAPKEVLPAYSFRVKTTLCPTTSGIHTFGFSSVGPGRLFLNEKLFIDNWDWTEEGEAMFGNSDDVLKSIHLEQNEPVEILVESTSEARPLSKIAKAGTHGYGGCRIGYQEEQTTDLLAEAVTIAKEADVAIIVVGLDNEWESEGYDRKTIALPKNGSQDALITAVLAANPNTIVVNQSGSPIAMPWADSAPAILQAWYQGQEAGNALADVLFGKASPSGKLPTTFPKRLEDCPAVGPERWGGVDGKVRYDEGVFVGYRHYEKNQVEPLWPFGHGLSYTNFVYGDARIDKTVLEEAEDGLTVSVVITNTGTVAGSDIVQAYVRDVEASLPRPEKELQAFAKVHIEPYQSETVRLRLDKYSVGFYDTKAGSWVAEKGDFEVLIGASSVDIRYVNLSDRMNVFVVSTNGRVIRCKVSFEVQKSFSWIL